MKKIKVFFNGKKLREIYPHATWFEVLKWKTGRFIRKVAILSFVAGLIWGGFKVGVMTTDTQYVRAQEVLVTIPIKAPVLDRIAGCESEGNPASKGSHVDPKTGHVRMVPNKNGTIDVGVMQINTYYWGKKAAELGYDLTIEKDNRAFAQYLYENKGTEPWVHSKPCWNK